MVLPARSAGARGGAGVRVGRGLTDGRGRRAGGVRAGILPGRRRISKPVRGLRGVAAENFGARKLMVKLRVMFTRSGGRACVAEPLRGAGGMVVARIMG
ncbi:putative aminotransferase [Streptomyces lydicamycinicus]|uniref:Putative aminotransferase n=1 Tax=Streptomyces lydicamycinicus TaxID=1546107 RepID=A0A0P4R1S2_9ACTN|nr:putative aminotransferase [Streptomyces lydicamycinicus]